MAAALLAVAMIASGVLPAGASTDPDERQDPEGAAGPQLSGWNLRLDFPAGHAVDPALAVWRPQAVGFAVFGSPFSAPGVNPIASGGSPFAWESARGWDGLVAYDLRDTSERARVPVDPPILATPGSPPLVIDQDGGRVVAAYMHRPRSRWNANTGPAVLHDGPPNRLCAAPDQANSTSCFAGVHVFDAASLESTGRIPFDGLQLDGIDIAPRLLDMRVSNGKVHLLLVDQSKWILNPTPEPSLHHRYIANLHFVVQMDLASKKVDWVARVDACRGARDPLPRSEHTATMDLRPGGAVMATDDAVWVGCHNGSALTGTLVRVPLSPEGYPFAPVEIDQPGMVIGPPPGEADPSAAARQGPGQEVFFGPDKTAVMLPDPSSGRLLLKVVDGATGQEVWWVFDTTVRKFVGTIGIGKVGNASGSRSAFDEVKGRLYVLSSSLGLLTADVRRTPLPQALIFPDLASGSTGFPAAVTFTETEPTRFFIASQPSNNQVGWGEIVDGRPEAVDPPLAGFEGRTLDLDEVDGVTQAAFDGAVRGYGARGLLVGGAEAIARFGPVDPVGDGRDNYTFATGWINGSAETPATSSETISSPCTEANRELILAFAGSTGPALLDAGGSRADAVPVVADSALRADVDSPLSRCVGLAGWNDLWATALFGRPPVAEPKGPWAFSEPAECVSGAEQDDAVTDSLTGSFSASVHCDETGASGWSHAQGFALPGLSVGQALSSFKVYRDPDRGVVSRVESAARAIAVDGVVRIDSVRAVAESWANGRRQPIPDAEREEGYDPNCDMERTAGTCLVRHVFGVATPAYKCGPCGDEQRLLDGLNRAMGVNGVFAFRQPDPELARGSDNGFISGISKPDVERFSDLVLNNDLLQTVLPGLELIRFAPPARKLYTGGPRGRQIIQFAGVEASSSYGIACLLVYDAATNTCAGEKQLPGSIQVSLSDTDGKPLAGGAFEVRADVDADGVLGLKDTLLPDGACVTAEDGIGTCVFENLQPGTYLVSQVAAPPGYAKSAEPWVSEVASGEQRTVAFTNVSNVSTIDMTVTDENGAPLGGAVFAAYPDADSDGKVAPDAKPAAECTTDAQGTCTMQVPAGSYVLVQTSAPGGLEGIEPVPFTFASGGQVASVTVVNYPPESPQAPDAAPSPVYTPPVDYAPPIETIDEGYVAAPVADQPVIDQPVASMPERIGGTVTQVIRAPGDALRLLARDPKQAVAWTAALALFVLAAMAIRRRQAALDLIQS